MVYTAPQFLSQKVTKLDPYHPLFDPISVYFLFHWYILTEHKNVEPQGKKRMSYSI